MRFPANVLSGFDATMGQTFFDLNDLQVHVFHIAGVHFETFAICSLPFAGLQSETMNQRQGDSQDEYKDAPGQVIASDFYHSNTLMPLSDDEVVQRACRNIAACEQGFLGAKVRYSQLRQKRRSMPPGLSAELLRDYHMLGVSKQILLRNLAVSTNTASRKCTFKRNSVQPKGQLSTGNLHDWALSF